MSLLDIRTRFRKLSGRFDLVDPSGNALDVLVDQFINDGQKFLDSLQQTQDSTARKVELIYLNDYKMPVKDLRAIKEVWVADSESRTRLTKVSLSDMREVYSNAVLTMGTFGTSILQNGNFATLDGTGWTFDAAHWDMSSGKAVPTPGDTGPLVQAYQDFSQTPIIGRAYRLTIAITSFTAGSVEIAMGGDAYTLDTSIGSISTQFLYFICEGLKDLTITPSADFDGQLDSMSILRFEPWYNGVDTARPLYYAVNIPNLGPEQGEFMGLNDFDPDIYMDYQELHFGQGVQSLSGRRKYRSVLFMPPADGTYTMTVVGLFDSPQLEDDTDVSFWSENHANLLTYAALREMEISYRNASGEASWTQAINRELFNIDKDLAEEESADINQMEG